MPTNPTSLRPFPSPEAIPRLRDAVQESRLGSRQGGGSGTTFADTLKAAINKVNDAQLQADEEINRLVTGESADLAQTMIAVQKASLSFQMMVQVRNKIVEAYEDMMRMPV